MPSPGDSNNLQLKIAGRNGDCSIFVLVLKKGQGGHAVGIHPDNGLHFFDPNFGEFLFPDSSDRDKQTFLDTWLRAYGSTFDRWGLDGVKRETLLRNPR